MTKQRLDLVFVAAIILEALLCAACLVRGVTALGYLLPVAVAVACTTLTVLAIRDFFRQHVFPKRR